MTIKVYVENYGEFLINKNKASDLIMWLQNNSNTSALMGEVVQHKNFEGSTLKPQPITNHANINHLIHE